VEVSYAGCCCYWMVCLTVEEVGIMLVCMMGLLPAVVGFVVDLVGFSSSSPPFEEKKII
jgi:hypothetical protein